MSSAVKNIFVLCLLAIAFAYAEVEQNGQIFTDIRDGKKYKTVKIGRQTWMAENLNYNAEGSKCYDNNTANCNKYGRYYDWNTAMKICPSGWHLPSEAEWDKLFTTVGGKTTAGKYLKATSGWNKCPNDDPSYGNYYLCDDAHGFAALPGGLYLSNDKFMFAGKYGGWWSTSEKKDSAYSWSMYCGNHASKFAGGKSNLYSVRCLQDVRESAYAEFERNGQIFTDIRDGKKYKTVNIGEQTWMAENLNYNAEGSKCYDNKTVNCNYYGRLYSWETAKTACPKGWHLPIYEEWDILDASIGEPKIAGKRLKATSGWEDDSIGWEEYETDWDNYYIDESGNGWDSYDFAALPGGSGFSGGGFIHLGYTGDWWSASEHNVSSAYSRYISINHENFGLYHYNKSTLRSIRCLQDARQGFFYVDVEQNGQIFTDSRDDKKYKTVNIGNQTWMAENLNYNAEGSKCYDNNTANCDKYGSLYDWNTARNVCPKGWHLPSDKEWEILETKVGGSNIAGNRLKTTTGWYEEHTGKAFNGWDSYGFAALPGGNGNSDGSFSNVHSYGKWWSASEGNDIQAYSRGIDYPNESVCANSNEKSFLFSVRCLQDAQQEFVSEEVEQNRQVFTDSRDCKKYKTVKIGNQTWMAENLNYNAEGSKCYDDNTVNCYKYGRFYNWYAAMKVCPSGWHLPTKEEWEILEKAVGGSKIVGKRLKATSGWDNNYSGKSGNGLDTYGFAALPGGSGRPCCSFRSVGNGSYWWSASEYEIIDAYTKIMYSGGDDVLTAHYEKSDLRSVRCLLNIY